MNKILSVALAVALFLSMSTAAFAEAGKDRIEAESMEMTEVSSQSQSDSSHIVDEKRDLSSMEPVVLGSIDVEPVCVKQFIQTDISGYRYKS